MKQLEEKIRAANQAYSIGQPYLTDEEYHTLWIALHEIDPHNEHLYHTSKDPTIPSDHIRHIHPIRGTQKAFTMEDLKPFLTRYKGVELVIQPKYDGVAAVMYKNPYNSGYPTGIVLFGDGIHGRDISYHAPRILHMTPSAAYEKVELIIPNKLWDKSYGKNPRNTVAGWVNSSEIKHPDVITAVSHENGPYKYKMNSTQFTIDALTMLLLDLYNEWSKHVPMDGLMIKVRDPKLRLTSGDNGTYYNWSIAWKPPIQTKQTRVVDIHWNVSRNGRVVPKVEYEPISLCGTENRFATGNNAQWVKDNKIATSSVITVGKAGEIIPKIISVASHNLEVQHPCVCPVCGEELDWKGVDLICNSPSCIVQLSKSLAYFYSDKGMDVKGIGEAMIMELLYNQNIRQLLQAEPWALLEPDAHEGLYVEIECTWGEARMDNYIDSLNAVSGKKDPARFIAALGYPGLAYKTALKLYQTMRGHKVQSNISNKAIQNFMKALNDLTTAVKTFHHFKLAPLPKPAKVTYCITGELSTPRNDMIDYLTTKGWQFSNQVSKHTDILILGDHDRRTIKHTKALELNITILYEDELSDYIKENAS